MTGSVRTHGAPRRLSLESWPSDLTADRLAESLTWVTSMLERCDSGEGHDVCREVSSSALPTRLLHIAGVNNVRLVTTDQLSNIEKEFVRYNCLSHRWGDPQPLITTKENLESFQKGISWAAMPRTFQDAIVFTYKLGIRYMWIDSLCILQKDVEDWQHEGSRMAEIYKNACLTISATYSNVSTTGLCRDVPSFLTAYTCQIPDAATCFGHQATMVHIRPWHSPLHTDHTCSEILPLFNRGWVYQEWLLSPRVVHFCANEVIWICQSTAECQCGRPIARLEDTFFRGIPKGLHNCTLHPIEMWQRLVSEYTERKLTNEGDKFPALQGIAKWFSQTKSSVLEPGAKPYPSSYVAGMWNGSLNRDLLWTRQKLHLGTSDQPTRSRPKDWRAPTWSWASVKGAVRWPNPGQDRVWTKEAKLEAFVELASDDAFGQLQSAELTIRGLCLTGTISGRYYHDVQTDTQLPTFTCIFERNLHSHGPGDEVFITIDDTRISHGLCMRPLKVVPVVFIVLIATAGNSSHVEFYYLILRKSSGGRFERIGRLVRGTSLNQVIKTTATSPLRRSSESETLEEGTYPLVFPNHDIDDPDSPVVRTKRDALDDYGLHEMITLTVI